MDNPSRSERSRKAVLQAALAIISRDGAGRLTLEAIARESGISKGGVMHQFRTKEAVIKALLELQSDYYESVAQQYGIDHGAEHQELELAKQIAVAREATNMSQSVAFAVLGAVVEQPDLLAPALEVERKKLKTIKSQAADPQAALVRWAAAKGLLMTVMLGICPLSEKEIAQLFNHLLDEDEWAEAGQAKADSPRAKPRKKPGK